MKTKNWLFALAGGVGLALLNGDATGDPQCSATTGQWGDYYYGYIWYLGPNGSGTVQTFCPYFYPFWGVAGSLNFNGTVSMTAYPPAPDYCPANWFRYDGAIARGGCNVMNGSWTNSIGQTGPFIMGKSCEVPTNGESPAGSMFQGRWAGPVGAYYTFYATVGTQGTTGNLSGRKYREVNYQPAIDGCYYDGSPIPRTTGVTGTVWDLDATNTYEDDIGWLSETPITVYRAHYGSQSCTVRIFQQLEIACGADGVALTYNWVYAQEIGVTISPTTISSYRGSVVQTRPYPYPY